MSRAVGSLALAVVAVWIVAHMLYIGPVREAAEITLLWTLGFGAACLEAFERRGLVGQGLQIRRLGLPDEFVTHGEQGSQRAALGLDAAGIEKACREMVGERRQSGRGVA